MSYPRGRFANMTTINNDVEALGKARLIGIFTPNSDDWHEARKGIGGSDIGAIAGLNPWKSAYTLFMQKTGRIGDTVTNTAMRLGTAFEEPIKRLWQEDNQGFLQVFSTGTWKSLENPNYVANPDGLIRWANGEIGVLEIKYTRQLWTTLPEHYKAQVTWYMMILGLKRAIVVAVAGGEMKEYELFLDPAFALNLKAKAEIFTKCLDEDKTPDYDGSASTYETIREMHPDITPGEVELPEDMTANLIAAKRNLEAAESALTLYKSVTLKYLAGTQTGTLDGVTIVKLQAKNGGKPFLTFK